MLNIILFLIHILATLYIIGIVTSCIGFTLAKSENPNKWKIIGKEALAFVIIAVISISSFYFLMTKTAADIRDTVRENFLSKTGTVKKIPDKILAMDDLEKSLEKQPLLVNSSISFNGIKIKIKNQTANDIRLIKLNLAAWDNEGYPLKFLNGFLSKPYIATFSTDSDVSFRNLRPDEEVSYTLNTTDINPAFVSCIVEEYIDFERNIWKNPLLDNWLYVYSERKLDIKGKSLDDYIKIQNEIKNVNELWRTLIKKATKSDLEKIVMKLNTAKLASKIENNFEGSLSEANVQKKIIEEYIGWTD